MAGSATPRRASALFVGIALTVVSLALLPLEASAASPPACRVKNATQGVKFASENGQALIDAIAAADAGDHLKVMGTCLGTYVIDKDLTVSGKKKSPATLDANGYGTVLTVDSTATATLTNVMITGGSPAVGGGGINNNGTLTLNASTVTGNTSGGSGAGGIDNEGTLTLNASTVSENDTGGVAGGIANGGTLTLNTSTVSENEAAFDGGGIFNFGAATLNSSEVSGNTAGGVGGGIFNEGTVTLNFSEVTGNTAGDGGGGILNVNTVILNSSTVSGNIPDDCSGC